MDRLYVLLMGFLSVIIVNNFVFTKFLGTCPYLGVSTRLDSAFGMGLAVTFVTALSGILTWLVDFSQITERKPGEENGIKTFDVKGQMNRNDFFIRIN